MTSRADDFGVRYDDGDADGWDTQGFRAPPDGYSHRPASVHAVPAGRYQGSGRHAGPSAGPGAASGYGDDYGPPTEFFNPETDTAHAQGYSPVSGYQAREIMPEMPARNGGRRRAGRGGRGGPAGPRGRGPRGPHGPRGQKIKGSWWRRWTWRKVLGLIASLIGAVIILLVLAVLYIYSKTPVPTEQMAAATFQQSVVYAADGRTVIGRFGTSDRQVVNYNQIPQPVIWSVLAAEDRGFFSEGGVSPTGILRAAYEDTLGGGNFQGGSTITQQFVRNYYQGIGTAQTVTRKIKEIFVAMKIARSKSKQWILENYLNTIYLGQGAYGIGAAAQVYFNIPVAKLSTITWSQAALLAAVIQQPSTYPLPRYRSDLIARWHYVVDGLVKMGKLTPAQAAALKFPKFGNYTPQLTGSAVWDPYVMNVVQNELQDIYHYSLYQLDNRGYKIVTTIDPAKMAQLYAAVSTEEAAMKAGGEGLQSYMHVGAVLENPADSSIEAMYAGPGYPGYRYNGTGPVITPKYCKVIDCEVNMAVYNREQVGSSFKPYILATAVSQGMNVQTSMLDGQDFVCIPPDKDLMPSLQNAYPDAATYPNCQPGWYKMTNDSPSENGAYTPTDAMTNSINTAYADLWHYVGGAEVVHMAAMFGVDTVSSGLNSPSYPMEHEAGVALGQASLTVGEQATMLSAIANGGTWHPIHIIKSIAQGSMRYPLKLQPPHNVFNANPTINLDEATQVQSAMQQVIYKGTAAGNGMSDGRQIISKTGTTNSATSTFFIGAIPQESLAVGIFTNSPKQTLNGLGGVAQNFGGTWSAQVWHQYAQSVFINLPAEQFPNPVFTGQKWILAPNSLLKHKKKAQHKHAGNGTGNPPNQPSAFPTPTATCPPGVITVACNPVTSSAPPTDNPTANPTPGPFNGQAGTAAQAAAAAGGLIVLPVTLFLVRRSERRRAARKRSC